MPYIRIDNQPVTQITVIEPEPPGKQAEALSLMTERARFMARQPGFILWRPQLLGDGPTGAHLDVRPDHSLRHPRGRREGERPEN